MWLTMIEDTAPGGTLRIYIFHNDIDEIQSGFDPEENEGCPSIVWKKNGDAIYVLEDEEGINAAMADDRRREFFYLQQ